MIVVEEAEEEAEEEATNQEREASMVAGIKVPLGG